MLLAAEFRTLTEHILVHSSNGPNMSSFLDVKSSKDYEAGLSGASFSL
jgi:hypothetical protein